MPRRLPLPRLQARRAAPPRPRARRRPPGKQTSILLSSIWSAEILGHGASRLRGGKQRQQRTMASNGHKEAMPNKTTWEQRQQAAAVVQFCSSIDPFFCKKDFTVMNDHLADKLLIIKGAAHEQPTYPEVT